ncbi:nucleoside hydrolase [Allomuricauda sp. SCSIO 65647]|uniref:nucleoside hydrolase n=1 Tax=Allomuricauda sp. SCSIO 65647 TaxID=2908843 RepID=UPI001F406C2E|nr:nucleoside hydrolase [Muricauda sp. SCSIO 65647]UJH67050.1 nucleoside hydrolase [Muricauda sp. SCSIO 65647]
MRDRFANPYTIHEIMKGFKVLMFILCSTGVFAQEDVYHGTKETIPKIPPKDEKIRTVIVSDAKNEIDDVWAIALAILSPEKFQIEGFVGSNYDHVFGVGSKSISGSVSVIETILDKAGLKGKYPVYRGSHPMQYQFEPSHSEGVDFIIEKAMEGSGENPLWVIGLGSATDLASAYLKEPKIADRVIFFWHGRTENTWPYRAHNYNVKGDMHAARILFHSPVPLVLFDTGTNLSAGTMEESKEHVEPFGELGKYLYEYRFKSEYWQGTKKGFFDLGDIAVLVDPELGKWEETICPTVTTYMDYNFYKTNGKFLRCRKVQRDGTFQMLYSKLREHQAARE